MVAVLPVETNVIRFSKNEEESIRKIIRQYIKNPTNLLKQKIIDKFTPSIQLKAAKAAINSGISGVDYAQDLYLRLLETLDSAIHNRKQVLATILNTLNKTESTKNAIVITSDKTIDELTQEEIFFKASVLPNETGIDNSFNLSPRILTKESEIMAMVSSGMSLEETIYKFNKYHELIPKPHITVAKPKEPNFDAEEIWSEVKKSSFEQINVIKYLDEMMRTQTTCKELFTDKSSRTKLSKKLALEPDFYFELKLSRKTDNPEFKRAAYSLSKRMFGRNIFKFTN